MKNKWLIALAAVGIHICIGSVYAWSVLTKPIMAKMGFTLAETTWTFSIAILFLGLSAGFLGSFVEKYGPRKSGLIATACFVLGLWGSALALHYHSLALLYLAYGVLGGIGLGIGYITPVSTLVKYFPKSRGFATGLAIMGFGFASLIAGPLMEKLVINYGLVDNFIILGCIYAVVMMVSSLYLAPPPKGVKIEVEDKRGREIRNWSMDEVMHSWQFYALWLIFFINITCGIGLLAVASPMSQEVVGMTAQQAAFMVGIIGLFNGAGRIIWSSISDYLGRNKTYIIFFAIQIVAFYILANTKEAFIFQAFVLLIVTCYGGGFSCMPAFLSDLFGVRFLSAIHGRILTAWGLAGIAGPLLLSVIRERLQSYELCLYVFAGMFVISLVVAIILLVKGNKKSKAMSIGALVKG